MANMTVKKALQVLNPMSPIFRALQDVSEALRVVEGIEGLRKSEESRLELAKANRIQLDADIAKREKEMEGLIEEKWVGVRASMDKYRASESDRIREAVAGLLAAQERITKEIAEQENAAELEKASAEKDLQSMERRKIALSKAVKDLSQQESALMRETASKVEKLKNDGQREVKELEHTATRLRATIQQLETELDSLKQRVFA
jgi:DNA repair exonuclease SbcCD ATPase subunit